MATIEDFQKLELRIGRIVEAQEFPQARKPAYRLRIDFGPIGERTSSAQITRRYRCEELVGRLCVAVVNFPPRQIGPVRSEVLVLGGLPGEGDVVLLQPDTDIPPGTPVG